MAAFSKRMTSLLQHAAGRLSRRILGAYRCDLTSDDLFEVFVKPEHREILTEVLELASINAMSAYIDFFVDDVDGCGQVRVNFDAKFVSGARKWLVPGYARDGMIKDGDPEIADKVRRWIEKRIRLGYECALVVSVFNELNWRCSAAALKYFMPSVIDLLDVVEGSEADVKSARELREKLEGVKVPGLPLLPPGLEGALDGVKVTIARARLLGKISEDSAYGAGAVSASITPWDTAARTPWGTTIAVL